MGKWSYGVILDAGSSGTRLYIYKWLKPENARASAGTLGLKRLPVIKVVEAKKIHPGISTFGDTPELVGPDHLEELFKHARKVIGKEEITNTPIFLLATAGMRLLPSHQRQSVLSHICTYTRLHTEFQVPDCGLHVQVIPGETEGLYGWIAANYLLGGFDRPQQHDHGKGHHTYGFLDMGGASAQIAFAPNVTEAAKHADDLVLLRMRTIDGATLEYKVFVTSWLGYGVNEARRRYVDALATASPDAAELPDPCLPSGFEMEANATDAYPSREQLRLKPVRLKGTGDFLGCMQQTYLLLDKDAPCPDPPCSMHGIHMPAIDFDVNHFVGVSEYWHTTHEVFEMSHKEQTYDYHKYREKAKKFCSLDWGTIKAGVEARKWGSKVDEQVAWELCFKASWLINVLHDGIGVPRGGVQHMKSGHNHNMSLAHPKDRVFLDPFQAINKIDGAEVSWTLGKMVLYASSQIPPAAGVLAVGFGPNEPGIPADFQYANYNHQPISVNSTGSWEETIVRESPRRIPGFIIFMFIITIAGLALCGRERRKILHRKLLTFLRNGSSSGRKPRGFSQLFRHTRSPMYERVLESGEDVETFELPDADSDNDHPYSTENSDLGKTSGCVTPRLNVDFKMLTPTFFGNSVIQDSSLGLTPAAPSKSAMDRSGLLSRTDSRERLAAGSVHRNGAASPTRMRSPLMSPFRELID